uniref:basic leucine zipper transcriptional factor ATF-like 3 isoform X1 n=1 Tax=Oncorhynchus gorbuscha TaxID=8017 RepID=UPI001EAECCED|nr:basic leucine zipper transcriptional factor ATF-like 3 isoform X1 [Oncorhynchus gorbuscha]
MSDSDISGSFLHSKNQNMLLLEICETNCTQLQSSGDDGDEDRRLKRREKNRVAAKNSRKKKTQRADELHEAHECLEQKNRQLKKDVQFLSEEQRRLTEALKAHEPLCPIMHCVANLGSGTLGPKDVGVPSCLPR